MQFGEFLPESDAGMRQPAAVKSAQTSTRPVALAFSAKAN